MDEQRVEPVPFRRPNRYGIAPPTVIGQRLGSISRPSEFADYVRRATAAAFEGESPCSNNTLEARLSILHSYLHRWDADINIVGVSGENVAGVPNNSLAPPTRLEVCLFLTNLAECLVMTVYDCATKHGQADPDHAVALHLAKTLFNP